MARRKVAPSNPSPTVTQIIRNVALHTYLEDAEERLRGQREGTVSRLKMKGAPGSRQIKIGDDGDWLAIDAHIESEAANLPGEVRTVALLLNGPDLEVRREILRAIAREHGWTVSGEFVVDSVTPGLAYQEFLEHARGLQCDALLAWGTQNPAARFLPPQLDPNIFKVPRDQWHKYRPWSGVNAV